MISSTLVMKIIITSLIIGVLFGASGARRYKCPNGSVSNRYGRCELSREFCQPGHYYAFGHCEACPCNNHEKSCEIDKCSRVHCHCQTGYTGKYCQNHGPSQIKLDKPLQVVVEPVTQTVHRGFDEIKVNCIVNDTDAQVMWLRNGQIYTDQRGQQVGRTFRIDKARDSDSGSYMCVAMKGGKAFKAVTSIEVIEPTSPAAKITPRTDGKMKVPLAERVELTCNADGFRSHVSWQRISADTGAQEIIQSSVTSEVHYQILSMSEKTAGEYICYAESPIGSDAKSIQVEIEPLVLKIYPEESQVVTLGQSVTLECRKPAAYPNVEVQWAREDGRPLESNAYQSPNGSLTIKNIMIKDEGRYNCSATKEMLSASAIAEIKVEILPIVEIPQSSHEGITVGMGEKKNLTCNASGHPPPNVQWQKFSEKTNSYEVVQQAMPNSVVYEHNPSSGNRITLYRCLASNSAGSSDKIVRVEPVDPLLEVLPGQSPVVTEGSSITLECRETVGYSDFGIHWRTAKRLPLAPNVRTANGSLIITNITSNQAGEYLCVGSNGGISISKFVRIEVNTLPVVRIPQSTDGNIIAKLGDKVKLTCNADGHPQPDVQWQKFSNKTNSYEAVRKATPKSSVYEITALSENEAGLYLCLAKNLAGSSEKTAQVVIKPPVVEIHPNVSRPVMSGSSVILECRESVGYPNMKIDWARDDKKPFGPNVVQLANGSLRITNIGISEEGRYKCSATNEVISAFATTEIEVKTLPVVGIPQSTDGNISAKLGDKVKLTCNADGHPQPDVQWQKFSNKTHSYETVRKATPKSSVYEITALSEDEAGLYLCLANNLAGSSEKTAQVLIKPPVVEIHPNVSRPVMSGSSVILECRESVGYPNMKIDWARDDKKPFGPNVVQLANGSLRITNIGISEEGRYKCSATNEVTSAFATTEIEVKTLPVVGIPQSTDGNISAKLGDKVKLICNADGHPQPDVQWQKFSNKTHSYETVRKATPKSSVYEITALSENEAGLYLCLAKNLAGSSEKTAQVVIKPPVVEIHPNVSRPVMSGSSVILECRESVGYPNMKIDWARDDKKPFGPNVVQLANGSLRITNIGISEEGRYKCSATNEVISAFATTEIEVKTLPVVGIPQSTDGNISAKLGDKVKLTCNADGHPQPDVQWQKFSNKTHSYETVRKATPKSSVYEITALSENEAGLYLCLAKNSAGSSEKTAQVLIKPPVVEIHPNVSRPVMSGSSVILECREFVGYPNMKIDWARDDKKPFGPNVVKLANGSLRITKIGISEEGRYKCSATNEVISAFATTEIEVKTLPVVGIPQSTDGNISAKLGDKVKLTCNADGHPQPDVQWQKFSNKTHSYETVRKATPKSSVYEITALSENEAGLYLCLANNSAGSSEKTARVVIKPPVVEIHPNVSRPVMSGSSVILECRESVGYPNMKIDWARDDKKPFGPNVVQLANGSLRITNIGISEEGRYKCSATNEVTSAFATTEIEVKTLPVVGIPQSTDGNISAKLGDKVKLICNADGHPQPDVQWQKFSNKTHSYETVRKATPKSSVYEIMALSENEAGLYLCLAKNSAGSSEKTAQVLIKPPVVEIHPNVSRPVMSGSSVILECREFVGYPNMKIDWARDDKKPFGPNVVKLANGSLRITKIGISEEGRYKCSATNEVTSAFATTEIEVKTLPVVGIPQSTDGNISAKLGDKVKLICNADGHPQPDVQWQKFSNKTHSYETVRKATPKSSVYEIMALSENEAGLYLCLAKNSAGSSEKTAQVLIKPPVVEIHPNVSRPVMSGSSVILECREFVGYPNMKIDWARDDKKPFGPNVVKLANGSLRITKIGISEEGRYKCSATNEVISASATTEIKVETLPVVGIPQSTDGNISAKLGDKVNLTCNADGHPQPDVQWQKFSNKTNSYKAVRKATPKSSVYEITALSENEAGLYLCLANNSAGSSNETTQVVIKPPVVEIHPNVSRPVMSGSSVILECREFVGYPNMKIDWARDDKKPFGPNVVKLANGSLRITKIGISEEGRYKCSATNEVISASATTEIKVETLPVVGIPQSTDGNISAKLGDKVNLTCNADGHPQLDVQWQKFSNKTNSYKAVRKATPKSSVYEITALSENEAGLYLCLANNSAGSSNETTQVVIKPPVVEIHPNVSRPVMSGSSVTLQCRESAGYSNMKIDWLRDDNKPFGPNVVKLANGSLTITGITIDDKGIYKCSVTTGGVSVSATKEIDVQLPPVTEIPSSTVRNTIPPPKTLPEEFIPLSVSGTEFHLDKTIKVSQKELQITVDEESEIVCEFESLVEQATIHLAWQRADGLPIPENFVVNDGVLKIYSPTKADSGEYICVALNPEGTVLFNDSSTVEVIAPPRIYLDSPSEFVIGDNVTLTCVDYSGTEPTYSWTVSDRSLASNEEALGNVLTIHGLKEGNKGEFCCKSQNTDGSDIACQTVDPKPIRIIKLSTSYLEVAVDASVEEDCSVVDEHGQKINLHWERSDDSSSSNVITEKDGHLTLSKVTKMDSGDYICRGLNAAGDELERKTLTLRVIAPPETIEITTRDVPDNNDVEMTCEATGDFLWYEWTTKEGKMLPNERGTWNGTLHINGVSKANDRTFCCKAFNGVGKIEECKQLPTLLIISKPDSKVLADSPFEVDCQVLGSDASKVHLHWRRADNAEFSEKTITNGGLLKISNVTKTDAGDYNCVGLGDDGTEYVRKTASLNVLSEPKVVFNSDETNFKVGGTLSATCTATGDEPITLKLETDDKVLLPYEKIEGPVLTVSDIPKNYERKYWCTATNDVGTSRAYLASRIKKVETK